MVFIYWGVAKSPHPKLAARF